AIVKGEKIPAPKEIDLQYAVASSLVGRAIRARDTDEAATVHGNILEYASVFPQKEMGVMLVSDLHRAIGSDIFSVPQFAQWSNAVADVMLYE
ncbi:MAG: ATPase, partial [Thioalkalispiraceae bacterium]